MRIEFKAPATGWLIVEPLPQEAEAAAAVNDADRLVAGSFPSVARRREYLGWRALLYRELGPQTISYSPSGAPKLTSKAGFIGVSHSRNLVGLCWSPTHRVALDIESQTRNFERIKSRYLTESEAQLSNHPAWSCIAWCAKETLYKLANRRELELLSDLQLGSPHFTTECSGWLEGLLLGKSHTLHFCRIDVDWVVWSE